MFKRNLDMNTSVSLVHDTLKIGNHPLMLRVTQNRNNHRYRNIAKYLPEKIDERSKEKTFDML